MDNSFLVISGTQAVTQGLTEVLEAQGHTYRNDAKNIILVDIPRGFALRYLELKKVPTTNLLVLTWNTCPEYWEDIWDHNPTVLICDNGFGIELSNALQWAATNTQYRITPNVQTNLTPLERQLLRLLARGYTNKKLSEEANLQEQTVKNFLSTIYQKLSVQNRTEAAMYYWGILHTLSDLG